MDRPLRGEDGVSDAVVPRVAQLRGDMSLTEVRFLSHPDPFDQLPRTLLREKGPREHAVVAADPECERERPRRTRSRSRSPVDRRKRSIQRA